MTSNEIKHQTLTGYIETLIGEALRMILYAVVEYPPKSNQ